MKIRFLSFAQQELDEAVEYYNHEVPGLGKDFVAEIRAVLERIRHFPNGWRPLTENVRRCRLRRFPYGLIYAADNEEIIVIAVAHLHRRPDYWRKRLGK
jgi:plasmid stabilization system protein ParE